LLTRELTILDIKRGLNSNTFTPLYVILFVIPHPKSPSPKSPNNKISVFGAQVQFVMFKSIFFRTLKQVQSVIKNGWVDNGYPPPAMDVHPGVDVRI
jgi:hypothetical protein